MVKVNGFGLFLALQRVFDTSSFRNYVIETLQLPREPLPC